MKTNCVDALTAVVFVTSLFISKGENYTFTVCPCVPDDHFWDYFNIIKKL